MIKVYKMNNKEAIQKLKKEIAKKSIAQMDQEMNDSSETIVEDFLAEDFTEKTPEVKEESSLDLVVDLLKTILEHIESMKSDSVTNETPSEEMVPEPMPDMDEEVSMELDNFINQM